MLHVFFFLLLEMTVIFMWRILALSSNSYFFHHSTWGTLDNAPPQRCPPPNPWNLWICYLADIIKDLNIGRLSWMILVGRGNHKGPFIGLFLFTWKQDVRAERGSSAADFEGRARGHEPRSARDSRIWKRKETHPPEPSEEKQRQRPSLGLWCLEPQDNESVLF